MKRISTFARVRLVWASTMLVVVPLSPGRFGSHRWIEPIWESCLVIYVSFMLFQIRRKLREPVDEAGSLLVDFDPEAAAADLVSGGADRQREPADAGAASRAATLGPAVDAGLGPSPRSRVR